MAFGERPCSGGDTCLLLARFVNGVKQQTICMDLHTQCGGVTSADAERRRAQRSSMASSSSSSSSGCCHAAARLLARAGSCVPVTLCIASWYASSMLIIFANKQLLSGRHFHFPFFMTACNNAIVALAAWLLSRLPRFRQPPLQRRTLVRVVLPIGVCTALDIGFSNWSLIFVSVSFHTIIKGTIPAFVLVFGFLLRLEPGSYLTAASIVLVCLGIGLAASAEVSFSARGFGFGLASSSMAGMRWALTQLLIKGPMVDAGDPAAKGTTAADCASGSGGASAAAGCAAGRATSSTAAATHSSRAQGHQRLPTNDSRDCLVAMGGAPAAGAPAPSLPRIRAHQRTPSHDMLVGAASADATADATPPAVASEADAALSRHVNPLGSVLYVSPVCALMGLLCSVALETDIVDSPFWRDGQLALQLLAFLLTVALLVFVLLLAEFCLVQLTSSLSLSVLGILKELCTILLAGLVRGDRLTWTNVGGFVICSVGVMLYQCSKNGLCKTEQAGWSWRRWGQLKEEALGDDDVGSCAVRPGHRSRVPAPVSDL